MTSVTATAYTGTNAARKHAAQRHAVQLARLIAPLRAEGKSLREIASVLTAKGVPTVRGGAWGPQQVLRHLRRLDQPPAPPASQDPLCDLIGIPLPTLAHAEDPLVASPTLPVTPPS